MEVRERNSIVLIIRSTLKVRCFRVERVTEVRLSLALILLLVPQDYRQLHLSILL
nr:MAG TPA: hypothetical protein [Bacteriophage sp.]